MIPLLFALLLAQEKAILEGTVVNALTNEPLRKAHVLLEGEKNRYAVVSGNEGKFRFEGLEPGDYTLEAQRTGFLDSNDEPEIGLAAGEHVKDVVIKMTPQGVIAGHVVDEDGDPVPGLIVKAARTIHVNGQPLVLGTGPGYTNKEGYFLVGELQAGRYYLSVEPDRHEREVWQPGHPGTEEQFVPTDDLVPRDIASGAALRNVEIHIRKTAVFRIRGRVSNPPKDPVGIRLVNPDGDFRPNDPQARPQDGAFEFAGIPPGNFVLSFEYGGSFCRIPVTVADHDVDGIVADLAPTSARIEGTIKIDGDGHYMKPPTVLLAGNMAVNPAVIKEDGTFEWTNLAPRRYTLVWGPPKDFYSKSIHFNHQPLTDGSIDLRSGVNATLDIVVAPNAATITATVPREKNIRVTLWSDSTLNSVTTDDSGAVSFANLAPGEYRIVAWQKINQEYTQIREFLARFDAQKITLTEGSHENVEVKLIPKSTSDAEVAKLQ